MIGLYRLFGTLAAPFLRLMLARRARRGKEIAARLPERRGVETQGRPPGRLLWLHAASVGEAATILPLLPLLPADLAVLLTTGTVTSSRLVAGAVPGLGRMVLHRFAPLDVPHWAARFLDRWRPDAAAFVESEIWPNLLLGCRTRAIPVALVNARLSDRAWRRWRCAPRTARALFGSFAWVQAGSAGDAARLRALGAAPVDAPGNLKWAAPPLAADPAECARLQGVLRGRPVWVAASLHPPEADAILAAHRRLREIVPDALLIIVPRHPERGAALSALAGHAPRRARGQDPAGPVWIGDTLGELGLFYRLAHAAFIGKSLAAPGGGQNPLEALRLGCPAAAGPYVRNFQGLIAELETMQAIARVRTPEYLAGWLAGMLRDEGRRHAESARARASGHRFADLPARTAARLSALVGMGHA